MLSLVSPNWLGAPVKTYEHAVRTNYTCKVYLQAKRVYDWCQNLVPYDSKSLLSG